MVPNPLVPGLDVLAFMIGVWRVEGEMHGEVVRGRTVIGPLLDGALLSMHETIFRPDGGVDYEDLCLYRFNSVEADLAVHHFTPPYTHNEYKVLPLEQVPGFHWVHTTTPGPFVRVLRGEPWMVEVWHPDGRAPEVVMRYYRG